MKIDLLDPVVEVTPGQSALCRVRVRNDSTGPSAYTLRVVGLYEVDIEYPLGHDPLPAGAEARFDVSLDVPREFAAGRHSLAVEVSSNRRDERPVLAGMTVDVSSIDKVALRINPSTITGHRTGRFRVEVDNREDHVVDLDLTGGGQDLEVRFGRQRLRLRPGDSVSVSGRVRGNRRLVRDPAQHVVTVAATGRSAPIYADAAFLQRPVLPRRLRSGMAILALLGLWAGILGGGAYWYSQRDNGKDEATAPSAELVDTNGDGVPDAPAGSTPADGEAAGGAGGGAAADDAAAAAAEAAKDVRPTSTVISGTVKAGETGDDAGVTVSLVPATLGGDPDQSPGEQASLARGGAGGSRPAKIWPSRYNRATVPGVSDRRVTESVISALSDGDGVWMFPDVAIPDNYEITFAKPGFDTKAFIVTPPEDGKAVALEVELDPATGAAGGVVNGPNGPLGGVDIVISDGVLTFNAKTSSEAGSVGRWSVTGLSTPSTYTLTATLRGYGTEVQQVALDPGEQRTAIVVDMVAGVGTIAGRILAAGEPLGGVTITASSGDLTRTTTSLTLGVSGSYSLPQLKIPGVYTITASADGYVTQTRELDLRGNATEVDFTLIRTTGAITGLVVSNVGGNLAGVGITVRHDDLTFNSTTAAAPNAGTFRIDELPPGEYLVDFTRYDHAEVSQLVTIVAGETKDFGVVMMEFRDRPPLVETGRLVVSVFDSATVPIGGATVQMLQISDGTVVRTATDSAGTESSFAFDNVPIGTYTVRVSRPNYRTTVQRVTMGLGERALTFNLLQLGQVTGRIVDAVSVAAGGTVTQLNNYEIKIYRLRADGTRDGAEIERIVVPGTAVKDADGNILWQSRPTSLTDGRYEVEVSVPPAGYSVTANQAIDPDDATAIMRFTVDPTDEGTIRLNDLRADPYPTLSGRLFVPRLDGVDPAGIAPDDIGFDPLDANAAVVLTCEGSTGSATATLSNEIGGAGLDTYTFTPIALDQADLLGNCSLNVSSDAFRTADIALGTPLVVSSGGVSSSRIVNVAIGREPASIGGNLFWLDTGRTPNVQIPVSTVNVITEGDVITGFQAAPPGGTNLPVPILATAPITGQNLAGNWSISGQVFGRTTYVFTGDSRFMVGKLTVTIDETTRTVTVVQNLSVADLTAAQLALQLTPLPGNIGGTVNAVTTSTAAGASTPAVVVDAVGSPSGPAPAIATSNASTGVYSVPGAAAGTWDLLFNAPSGYRFLNTGALTAKATTTPFLLGPTESFVSNPRLYQLATLDITVNADPAPFTGAPPVVTLHRVATGANGDPGADASIPVTLVGNRAVITDLPVNWVDPIGSPASYFVTVEKDGYDTETVAVSLDGGAPTFAPGEDIAVPLRAGDSRTIVVTLSRFGSISGTVEGRFPWAAAAVANLNITNDPNLQITIARELDLNEGSVPGTPLPTLVRNDNSTATPADDTFSITGPPGFYSITMAHPSYTSPPYSTPTDPDAPASHTEYFRLTNGAVNTLAGPFVFTVIPSAINVSAIDGAGNPVSDAVVHVTGGPTSVTDTETAAGLRRIGDLAAGTYTVEVRKLNALGVDERFPVRVSVSVQYGTTASAREVDLVVRLVALDGSITGTVRAVNDDGRAVPLPAAFTIARSYTVGATATADGANVANNADEGDLGAADPPNSYVQSRSGPLTTSQGFTLTPLPRGLHQLLFSVESGYLSPTGAAPNQTPIDATIVNASVALTTPVTYTATDVTVQVTVLSGRSTTPALPSATVTLVPSWAQNNPITPINVSGNVYTFSVAPDLETYAVHVVDPLHVTSDTNITVSPQAGTLDVDDIVMVPNRANIIGAANKQDVPGTDIPLTSNGTVKLFSGATLVATVTDVNGVYTFPDVTATGPYTVELSLSGYVTTTSTAFSVELGRDNTGPAVSVPKLAGAVITVAGATVAPTATSTPGTAVGTCTVTSCSFDNLTPGTAYTFTVTPAGADVGFLWPGSTTATPTVGGSATGTVTLAARNLTFAVTTTGSATDAQTATVVLKIPASATGTSLTGTGSANYTFNRAPLAAGTVTVSRTGYLTIDSQAVPADTSAAAEAPIAITLARALTDVTGTISNVPAGFSGAITVTATSADATPGTRTTSAVNTGGVWTYSIDDLTWGTWTVAASGLGAGAGANTTDIVVNGTAATTTARDIALTARLLNYRFDLEDGAALNGVTVSMGGVDGVTSGANSNAGRVTLAVPETASRNWTATLNGYITQTGSIAIGSLTTTTNVPSIDMDQIPAISGNVRTGTTPANTDFDTLYFCRERSAPLPAEPCAPSGADYITSVAPVTASPGVFSIPVSTLQLPAGNYRIRVQKGAADVSAAVTITASGSSIASITITIP